MKWTPPSPDHMARMLPQYDQWQKLGQGGMGAVYQARQISLDRIVAVKILPPEAADDEERFIERFKNEARTMAKMNHPAIVGVFDFGETSEGQLYFVMEFVEGTDVARLIQEQGRLEPERALEITARVCDALQYAHDRSVIHRDIKPANILINSEGDVKVADFGLAKMNDPMANLGLTRSGVAMGTPDFVAPEALLLGVEVDHRADLYAVGVMLYQMLTGKIPRGVFSPATKSMAKVDPRIDAIVTKAMAEDREERYASAAQIRHDVDVILAKPYVESPIASPAALPPPHLNVAQHQEVERWQPPVERQQHRPSAPKKSGSSLVIGALGALAVGIGAFFLMKKPESTSGPSIDTAAVRTTPPKAPESSPPPARATVAPPIETAPITNPPAPLATAPVPSTIPQPAPVPAVGMVASVAPDGETNTSALMSKPPEPPVIDPRPWQDLFAKNLISMAGLMIEPNVDPGAAPRYRATSRVTAFSTADYRNCIIRGRFSGKWINAPSLIVRYDSSRTSTYISTGCFNYTAHLRNHQITNTYRTFAMREMDSPLLRAQTVELELKAEGDTYTFSRDGKVLVEGSLPDCPTGRVGFNVDIETIIEKLEVLPLDDGHLASSPIAAPGMGTSPGGTSASMLADPRLAQLDAGFQARYESVVQKPHEGALAALNQSYAANGITRARAAALATGNAADIAALDAEKAAIDRGLDVPSVDAPETPESLKALRATYRTALAKLEAERAKSAAPLYALYVRALDVYASELNRAGNIAEAQKVKTLRDDIAAKGGQSLARDSAASRSAFGAKPPPGSFEVTLDWIAKGFTSKETGYRPQRAELSSRKPKSVTKEPSDISKDALYATLVFGSEKNETKITVLLDELAPDQSRLWVDANGNGDLTDDPAPPWVPSSRQSGDKRFFTWSGSTTITVNFGEFQREVGLRLYRFDKTEKFPEFLFFYRDFGLAGKATIAGKTYDILVGDHTANGDFMSSRDAYLKLDLNNDGKYDYATEVYKIGEPLNIEGTHYEIVGLKPGGNTFQLRQIGKRPR